MVCVCVCMCVCVCACVCRVYIQYIRGVTGGTDQTSGGCSLCYTVKPVKLTTFIR